MNKDLQDLIDAVMEPLLQWFRVERKRIVAAILTEDDDEVLDDPFADTALDGFHRELRRREIYRQAQAEWMMQKLINRISRLESEEDTQTDDAEIEGGGLTGQFQQTRHDNLL
jgi:hypothetical protein